MHDVIIVGGGPAGLSAALLLGRCRRDVLLCDAGHPRNAASKRMHGFLTRDGIEPLELRRLGREEVRHYGVEIRDEAVVLARCLDDGGFEVELEFGERREGRKLLLATGMVDELPPLPGLGSFYGVSVHHCPYCDGWECRDAALAAYGLRRSGVGLAISLLTWSEDVVLCTDGPARLRDDDLARLEEHRIAVSEQRIDRLEGRDGRMERIVFRDGSMLERQTLFFTAGQRQRSPLAEMLGCRFDRKGGVRTDRRERTGIAGLFLAGDASRDVQLTINAAAEGAVAALAINAELQHERGRRMVPPSPQKEIQDEITKTVAHA